MAIYFVHHRAASAWFAQLAADLCNRLGLRFDYVSNRAEIKGHLDRHVPETETDFLVYSDAESACIESILHMPIESKTKVPHGFLYRVILPKEVLGPPHRMHSSYQKTS